MPKLTLPRNSQRPAGAGAVATSGDWFAGWGARGDLPPAFAAVRGAAGVEPVGDDGAAAILTKLVGSLSDLLPKIWRHTFRLRRH
jgi:hypothetical protein